MAKTIFEEMGGTYTQIGDYLLPDLKLPEEEQQSIGGAASPALPEGASTGNLSLTKRISNFSNLRPALF